MEAPSVTSCASRVSLVRGLWRALLVLEVLVGPAAVAGESRPGRPSPERGREFVHSPMNPPFWSPRAYHEAWRQWGCAARPADYARAFRERYGLHESPYENGGLPMGFTRPKGLLGLGTGLGNDCLLCHAGKVAGQTIIGLGNTSLDMQSLYEEMAAADGLGPVMPLPLCNVRGTSEASNFAVYLMQFRDRELRHRLPVSFPALQEPLRGHPCVVAPSQEADHLSHGSGRQPLGPDPDAVPADPGQQRRIHQGPGSRLCGHPSLPAGPGATQVSVHHRSGPGRERKGGPTKRAASGATAVPTRSEPYPNKLVDLKTIGTDSTLATAFAPQGATHYLESWFARERGPRGEPYHGLGGGGYQAPPLDGIWATAPYFHNGSVPTIHDVVKSSERPGVFTRSFRGEVEDYDQVKVGFKVTVLNPDAVPSMPAIDARKIYDTNQPGRSNGGHTFGDALSEPERMALIEYLKTF